MFIGILLFLFICCRKNQCLLMQKCGKVRVKFGTAFKTVVAKLLLCITLVEIKGKHIKNNLEQYKKFLRCCEDGGVLLIALNRRIAEKASEARFYSWPNEKNLKPKTQFI